MADSDSAAMESHPSAFIRHTRTANLRTVPSHSRSSAASSFAIMATYAFPSLPIFDTAKQRTTAVVPWIAVILIDLAPPFVRLVPGLVVEDARLLRRKASTHTQDVRAASGAG